MQLLKQGKEYGIFAVFHGKNGKHYGLLFAVGDNQEEIAEAIDKGKEGDYAALDAVSDHVCFFAVCPLAPLIKALGCKNTTLLKVEAGNKDPHLN